MNLVQMSATVRKTVVIVTTLIILYITFLVLKNPVRETWYAIFPPKDLPDYAFGLLDPLSLTEVSLLSPVSEYVLNTQTGALPNDLENKMTVFKYVPPTFSFGGGEEAQKNALALGYDDTMRVSDLNQDIFVWKDVLFGGSLAIDTQTKILNLNNSSLGRLGSLLPAGVLTQESALEESKKLLQTLGRFSDKLYTLDTKGSQTVRFGKVRNRRVIEADSILETQLAKVDFFRQVKDYPILGPDPKQGLLQVILRAPEVTDRFRQLDYLKVLGYHWEIDTEDSATYPIIPVSQAWEQVLLGNGVISNVTPQGTSPFEGTLPARVEKVLITDVYLAYFDDHQPQTHLQPIYVFEGVYRSSGNNADGIITVYYPAISGTYVKQPVVESQPDQL
jgi:hypothetical protein